MEETNNMDLKPCACGCGLKIIPYQIENGRIRKDRPIRFKKYHQNKFIAWIPKNFPDRKGNKNQNWRGGKYTDNCGYNHIRKAEHHFAEQNGYVLEHRLVWEEYHKAILLPWSVVHHKNGVRDDNRIENLEGMMSRQHKSLHFILKNPNKK
jgi:hypothetical protein